MHETGAIKSLVDTVDPNRPAPAFPVNGKSLVSCRGGSGGQVLPHVKKNIWRDVQVLQGQRSSTRHCYKQMFFLCVFWGRGLKINTTQSIGYLAANHSVNKTTNTSAGPQISGGSHDAKVTLVSRNPEEGGVGGGASGPRHPGPCEPFDSMQGIGGGGMLQLGLKALFGLG